MPRRQSFTSVINQIAREQAKAQRMAEAEARRAQREAERVERERIRLQADQDKEAKLLYLNSRLKEAEELNHDLTNRVSELQSILYSTLSVNNAISFENLKAHQPFKSYQPPANLVEALEPPSREKYLSAVHTPSAIEKLIPGVKARYEKSLSEADSKFNDAYKKHESDEEHRKQQLQLSKDEYEIEKQAYNESVEKKIQEVTEFENAYFRGDPSAVISYNVMVLEQSNYPDGLPQEFRVAYVPDSKELVIEYELPDLSLVPNVTEYRYVKTKDIIEEKPRKLSEVKDIYQDIIASVTLRAIHEVFEADLCNHILLVVFNGFVQTIDPATGKPIRPCLVSIRTTKDKFSELDLSLVDKKACLRNLGAVVSPRPAEMQPVKPVIEFDMVDKRFVEESDILGGIDSRTNLMELNPFEFENLVSNLFQKMGLQTKQTRSSKDGGVDAIAYDTRPILGGKVIIQAKRYKNTVGVSAVRDLYGTMMNEGANKGILVATSSYGPDAYEFSKDKPIELIDGGGLLYLLDQVGIQAKIIFPED